MNNEARVGRWEGIEEFIAVVDHGSFSAAARALGVSKAHVSQQVSRLEDRLGSRLLHRTTRKMSLSETGAAYLQRCRHIVEELVAAEREVASTQHDIAGRLRISSPHLLGEVLLVPALTAFHALHPALDIDIDLSSHRVNLLQSRYDIAIQMGARKDVNVVNHPLFRTRFSVVASPAYLATRAPPQHPDELKHHHCLLFASEGESKPWKFQSPEGRKIAIAVHSRWRSNSGHLLRAAAKSGLGLAYLPDYYLQADVEAGRLCKVMLRWPSIDRQVVAIYQERRHLQDKIRAFLDYLTQFVRDHPLLTPARQ